MLFCQIIAIIVIINMFFNKKWCQTYYENAGKNEELNKKHPNFKWFVLAFVFYVIIADSHDTFIMVTWIMAIIIYPFLADLISVKNLGDRHNNRQRPRKSTGFQKGQPIRPRSRSNWQKSRRMKRSS